VKVGNTHGREARVEWATSVGFVLQERAKTRAKTSASDHGPLFCGEAGVHGAHTASSSFPLLRLIRGGRTWSPRP